MAYEDPFYTPDDPDFIWAMQQQESGGNPAAVSSAGAIGIMQMLPGTFAQYGRKGGDIYNEIDNTEAGTNYIKDLYSKYKDIRLALAAYNHGPGNLNKKLRKLKSAGLDPSFENVFSSLPRETKEYVLGDSTGKKPGVLKRYEKKRAGTSDFDFGGGEPLEGEEDLSTSTTTSKGTAGSTTVTSNEPKFSTPDWLESAAEAEELDLQNSDSVTETTTSQEQETEDISTEPANESSYSKKERAYNPIKFSPFSGIQSLSQFKLAGYELATSPEWLALSPTEKVDTLANLAHSGQWGPGTEDFYKTAMTDLWKAVPPGEQVDFNKLVSGIAPMPILSGEEGPVVLDDWERKLKQGMLAKGIFPSDFGEQFDDYLKQAKQNELDASEIRNRGIFAEAGHLALGRAEQLGRGFLSGIAAAPAAVMRYGPGAIPGSIGEGFGEFADYIKSTPGWALDKLIGPQSKDLLYQTDDTGHVVTDEFGNAQLNEWSGVFDLAGNIAGMFGLGTALGGFSKLGKAEQIATFLGTNIAVGMEFAHDEAKAEGGTDAEAWQAGLIAIPGAFLGGVVGHFVLRGGPALTLGMKPLQKALAIGSWAATRLGAVEGPAMAAQQAWQSTAAGIALGRPVMSWDKIKDAYFAGVLGGAIGTGIVGKDYNKRLTILDQRIKDAQKFAKETGAGIDIDLDDSGTKVRVTRPLTLDEHESLGKKLTNFQDSLASALNLTPTEAAAIPQQILENMGFQSKLSADGTNVELTKKVTYTPIDSDDLKTIDSTIQNVQKYITEQPTSYEGIRATMKVHNRAVEYLRKAKEQHGPELENSLQEVERLKGEYEKQQENVENAVRKNSLSDIEAAKRARDGAFENLTALDNAGRESYKLWQTYREAYARLVKTKPTFDLITKGQNGKYQFKRSLGVIQNDVQAAEQNLKSLLQKREEMFKLARDISKTEEAETMQLRAKYLEEAGLDNVPPQVDLSRGVKVAGKVVMPYNGEFFILNEQGVTSTGRFKTFKEAVDSLKEPELIKEAEEASPISALSSEEAAAEPTQLFQKAQENIAQRKGVPISQQSRFRLLKEDTVDGQPLGPHWKTYPDYTHTGEEKVPAPDVLGKMMEVLNTFQREVKVLYGGSMPANALGYFHYLHELMKVGRFEDVQTSMHEMTHALKLDERGMTPDQKAALIDHYDKFYKLRDLPLIVQYREGIANFFQHYFTNQPVREEILDWYHTKFKSERPELYSSFEDLKSLTDKFWNQKPELFVEQAIRTPEGPLTKVIKKITPAVLIDKAFDIKYAERQIDVAMEPVRAEVELKRATIEAKKAAGITLKDEELLQDWEIDLLAAPELHKQSEANQRRGDSLARNWMHGELSTSRGSRHMGSEDLSNYKNLQQIFESVGETKSKDLVSALTARRTLVRILQGIESHISLEDARGTLSKYTSDPTVLNAMRDYDKLTELLQYNVSETSPAGADLVQRWQKANVEALNNPVGRELTSLFPRRATGYWIPWGVEGFAAPKSWMKAKGSTRPPVDFRYNIEKSIKNLYRKAFELQDLHTLIQFHDVQGHAPIGGFIREVTKKIGLGLQKEANERIKAAGADVLSGEAGEAQEGVLAFMNPWYGKAEKGPYKYFSLMDKGKLRFFEIDPRLSKAVTAEVHSFAQNPLVQVLWATPGRILRPWATTFNVAFQFKQLLRDPVTAWRYLDTKGLGVGDAISLYKYVIGNLYDQALFHGSKGYPKDKWFGLASRLGLTHMTQIGEDRALFLEQAGKLKLPGELFNKFNNFYNVAEVFCSAPELATRTAAMRMVAKQMGIKNPDVTQLSAIQAVELIAAFQRATTNFGRQGEWARLINIGVPFFTARIAELSRLPEDIRRNPKKAIAIATGAVTLGLWHAIAHDDKQWYRETAPAIKMNNASFETNYKGVNKVFSIPLDSWSAGFWGIGQMIGNSMMKDPNLKPSIVELAKAYFGQNVNPLNHPIDLLGVAGKELVQQESNWDYYYGRKIVPPNLDYKSAEDQITEYTSKFAEKLGSITGWSPVRIDHIIRAFMPAASKYVSIFERTTGIKKDTDHMADVWSNILMRAGSSSSIMDRSSQMFYDNLIKARGNKPGETSEEKTVREKLEKINKEVSYVNTALHLDMTQVERDELRQIKRNLLNLGLDLVRGEIKPVVATGLKGKAMAIRKQETKEKSESALRKRFGLTGSTE